MSWDRETVTLVAALLAAFIGLINYRRGGLEKVAAYRFEWTKDFRQLISEWVPLFENRLSNFWMDRRLEEGHQPSKRTIESTDTERREWADRYATVEAKLKLMLEPTDSLHAPILKAISDARTLIVSDLTSHEINARIDEISNHIWSAARQVVAREARLAERELRGRIFIGRTGPAV